MAHVRGFIMFRRVSCGPCGEKVERYTAYLVCNAPLGVIRCHRLSCCALSCASAVQRGWGLLLCNPSSLKAAWHVEMPHTRSRNDTEDLGKMCVNIRRLAFRTLQFFFPSVFPSAECPASRHGSGVRAFILREGLVSLCQVNLFNIAAKYNKSHVPNAPEGAAVITTSWPI